MTDWPFRSSTLLAGLRRFLDTPNLHLHSLQPMAHSPEYPGAFAERAGAFTMQPILAEIEVQGSRYQIGLILKRAASAAIACEQDFHRFLAFHLPVVVPGWVAGESSEGWLVMEKLQDLRPPNAWSADDYRQAADNLASLHDRFYGLQEDLDAFGQLARPFDRDYAAIKEKCTAQAHQLTGSQIEPRINAAINLLLERMDAIAAPLREQEFGLIHGDYWADNIASPLDGGRHIIANWQHAAIAPHILDVVFFYQQSSAHLQPALPLEGVLARYRMQLELFPRHLASATQPGI